jgi:perosamine synthetase
MKPLLSYGKHWIDQDDIAMVVETLQSDFLTQGPRVNEFENAFANYVGAKYAVAVSNGTAALHIAVRALNIPAGKKGLTSPITFAASANCFLYNNLLPSFADIDARTYCMDPQKLRESMSAETKPETNSKTKAGINVVIPVHFAGQTCDMDAICKALDWGNSPAPNAPFIIEDASHAIGSKYENGKHVGSCCHSDMTIFSFHPVKTIATGEGGMVTTNNKELYEKLLILRTHGITKDSTKYKITDRDWVGPWYHEMQELGFNYRLTDIQCALGISQLRKIEGFANRRREIVKMYNEAFKGIEWLTIPYERENLYSVFHLYVVKIDFEAIGKTRTQVMKELLDNGVGTQVHYIPVHLHPFYRETYGFKPGDFPISEDYYRHCLSIPLYPRMKNEDVTRVVDSITGLYKK